MAHEGLNTIDPTVATRWITEIENKIADNKADAALNRYDLNKIYELAEGAGLNRKAAKRLIKRRAFDAQDETLSEEEKEQIELLKDSIGDLPLGHWAVSSPARTEGSGRKRNAAAPGTVQAGMTLAEAKAILEKPKGRGRPSKERLDAEKIVAEADAQVAVDTGLKPGASGEQAEAMAEAMGPDPDADDPDDERGDNVEDLRPRFNQTA